jgi:integrase
VKGNRQSQSCGGVSKRAFSFCTFTAQGALKADYALSSTDVRSNAAVKRAGIRRRNPYHTRHTFACWLLSAGANPSFIVSQMGHENAQMVYDVCNA